MDFFVIDDEVDELLDESATVAVPSLSRDVSHTTPPTARADTARIAAPNFSGLRFVGLLSATVPGNWPDSVGSTSGSGCQEGTGRTSLDAGAGRAGGAGGGGVGRGVATGGGGVGVGTGLGTGGGVDTGLGTGGGVGTGTGGGVGSGIGGGGRQF